MSLRFAQTLWSNRALWWTLTERDVLGRYRGSLIGMGWSFLQPLAMLSVYTFVFSQVFKAKWGTLEESGTLSFAINLFAGLIVFNLVAECMTRAPGLILANPNYVKKVIFPLEVLGSMSVGSAVFAALTSLAIMMVFQIVASHGLPWSYLWLPLVWLPLLMGLLGITWLLAAIGVFIRDIDQSIRILVNMLMFLCPIFFPISALPERWQPLLRLNPIAQVIEQTRTVTVNGTSPSIEYLIYGSLIGILICELSFRSFQKSKRAFADVM
jgi:lipopolysaccharide transport system permease protein